MEINTKTSQNAYEMYKFVNFWNLMKTTGKKQQRITCVSKKLIFGQTYMEFEGYHGSVKNDGHTIDISKYPRRMNEQLMKDRKSVV